MSWDLEAELAELEQRHLRRRLRVSETQALNFASNDYLGLAQSDFLKQTLLESVARQGAGSGASRLVVGTKGPHQRLEEQIAAFKQKQAALTFSSGYAASVGVITSVVGSDDVVLLDKFAHASLIDAAKLSGATIRVFPHNHLGKLERLLQSTAATARRTLIVTESIFSMDGDECPLREIVELKDKHGAWLLLDEAHAIGVIGPGGRGLAADLGLADQVEIHLGTLSKALGLSGGYIAGSRALIDVLINRARSFIYTTAPPPALAEAAAGALAHVSGRQGDSLRQQLHQNVQQLRHGLQNVPKDRSAIIPYIVGAENAALELAEQLRAQHNIIAPAIRYPTVPRGTARLRLSVSAIHSSEEIQHVTDALSISMKAS
ncbi:MAG: 8-amino-7-oxononanoate synthase [Verrucomicrobiaceae bacterium]|nr:8-amino-7-oxononanoate synthase [Verrucomicrobiaceae bacterium]